MCTVLRLPSLHLAAISFTPYARRQCGKGVEADSYADDQSPTMMQDPAEATGEAEAAFERRVHAHIVETERRTRAFAAWVAEQDRSDRSGWPRSSHRMEAVVNAS